MDVCAIDAYPWVMWTNIIAMGWFSTRFMKKPYISTENYILRMSNYKKTECIIWKSLFYNFLIKNKNKLLGTSRIYLRNLKSTESHKNVVNEYKNIASLFIEAVSV
jgi:deoxyribodipyrimidine photolyase-related protein